MTISIEKIEAIISKHIREPMFQENIKRAASEIHAEFSAKESNKFVCVTKAGMELIKEAMEVSNV